MEKRKLKIVAEEEVRDILNDHNLWLSSDGKQGTEGNLSNLDMSKLNLSGFLFEAISLTGSDLSNSKLKNCIFSRCDLSYVDLSNSDLFSTKFYHSFLQPCKFINAYLRAATFLSSYIEFVDFSGANLSDVDMDISNGKPLLTFHQERSLRRINSSSLIDEKNIENNANFEVKKLRKVLEEKEKNLEADLESEKGRIQVDNKIIIAKLEEKEKELERERAAKKSTKEDIENGIKNLQAPNNYLKKQINIQYGLTLLYGVLGIIVVWFLFHYVYDHYSEFKENLTEKTTFLQWLFYALPIAICFSLIITFINQINRRLRNVIALYEKKRYVDSISGGLKAVQELSENNKEARARISSVLDVILNNTITLSEKLQEDTLPDEKPIENKVSLSVKELKDLFSK